MPDSTTPQLLSTPEDFLSESLRRWMSQYQFIAHTHVVDALSHRYIDMLFPTRPAASASLVDSAVVKPSSLSPSFLTTAKQTPLRNPKSLQCCAELCSSLYRHTIVDQQLRYPSDDEEEAREDSLTRNDSVHDSQVATVLRRFVQEILTGETRRSLSHDPAAHHHLPDDDVVMNQFRDACETFLLSRRHVHDDRPHKSQRSCAALLHGAAAPQQPAALHLLAVGTSVKKRYEIDVLAPFIHGEVTKALDALNTRSNSNSKGDDTPPVNLSDVIIVDIGAGQGYLSAQLAVDYGYTVVAVEREGVQLCGSIKRSQVASLLQDRRRAVKSGGTADGADAAASVDEGCLLITDVDIGPSTTAQTLLTNVLAAVRDHESIVRPTSAGVDNNGLRRTSVTRPVVLISLHACGPLSTNMLRLYADWQMAYEEEITLREPMAAQRSVRPFQNHPCIANVNVGCCYTYLQGGAVDGFPISQLGRSVIAQCPHGFQGRPERRRSGAASAAAVSGTDLAVDNENLLPPHHLILTRNMAMAACQAPWRWFDDYDGVVEENTNDRNSLLLRKSKRESSTTADNNNTRLTLHEDVAGTFSSLYLRALLQRYLCHGLGVDDLDVIGRVPAPQSAATTTATTNAAAGGAVSGGAPPKKPVHQKKQKKRARSSLPNDDDAHDAASSPSTAPPAQSTCDSPATHQQPAKRSPACEEDTFVAYATSIVERVRARCLARHIELLQSDDTLDDGAKTLSSSSSGLDASLRRLYRTSRRSGDKEKISCLWTIKALVGHGIEGVVLEDRVQYLLERLGSLSSAKFRVWMEPIFDPRESPRSQAIVSRWSTD